MVIICANFMWCCCAAANASLDELDLSWNCFRRRSGVALIKGLEVTAHHLSLLHSAHSEPGLGVAPWPPNCDFGGTSLSTEWFTHLPTKLGLPSVRWPRVTFFHSKLLYKCKFHKHQGWTVVKVVLWSGGAHPTKPGWSKPNTHSNPTNSALFRHKITL